MKGYRALSYLRGGSAVLHDNVSTGDCCPAAWEVKEEMDAIIQC